MLFRAPSPNNKCPKCRQVVDENIASVTCDACSNQVHIDCSDIPITLYLELGSVGPETIVVLCNTCRAGLCAFNQQALERTNAVMNAQDLPEQCNISDRSICRKGNDVIPTVRTHPDTFIDYEMLGSDQLIQCMNDIIRSISEIINVRPIVLRLLLDHFKWDRIALSEYYFEHGETKTLEKAGITNLTKHSSVPQLPATAVYTCDVCEEKFCRTRLQFLPCAHYMCVPCWQHYLETEIKDGRIRIRCPISHCDLLMEDEQLISMLQSSTVVRQYQQLISNSFVRSNQSITWCPGLNCGFAVRFFGLKEPHLIKCTNCDQSFCFACGQHWHDPLTCKLVKWWLSYMTKMEDDSEKWIVKNTKECPKCHTRIQKNGGCNHMTCRAEGCGYHFCWICLGVFENYQHICAQLTKISKNTIGAQNLERFVLCRNRYMNHLQSLQSEVELSKSVRARVATIHSQSTIWFDTGIYDKVVDILCQCRRTLMYSYVFAFSIQENNEYYIFETNLNDLNSATEELSDLLSGDISTNSLLEIHPKLKSKSTYCDTRRNVLVKHIQEGYDNNVWIETEF